VIAPDYMAHGMRLRASEIATEWLGPRSRSGDASEPGAGGGPAAAYRP
jgi:hypothetical protein